MPLSRSLNTLPKTVAPRMAGTITCRETVFSDVGGLVGPWYRRSPVWGDAIAARDGRGSVAALVRVPVVEPVAAVTWPNRKLSASPV